MSDVAINKIKEESISLYKNALNLFGNGQIHDACKEFKKLIHLAEKIFHYTNLEDDLHFLIKNYLEVAKCYNLIHKTTNDKKDLSPCCLYYEKAIYLYEEKNNLNKQLNKDDLVKLMEIYVQLLWTYLELKNYKSYNNFKKNAKKNASKLVKIANTFENQQYLLLVNIFEADYLKIMNKYRRSYVLYIYLLNKLKLIYEKLPQEGIKNDLIMIYDNLIEISTRLNKDKQKQKWEQQLKEIGGK